MRRHAQLEELQSLNATQTRRKARISMKQAVAPYIARMVAMNADRVNMSVNWTDNGKGKGK